MKDTRIELVEELVKLRPTEKIENIVALARQGAFHDFKSEVYPAPKIALHHLLTEAGLTDLARQVVDGEYDEEPDEHDIAELRKLFPEWQWPQMGLA